MDNSESRQGVIDDLAILHALRAFDFELMRRSCFPLCLIRTEQPTVTTQKEPR